MHLIRMALGKILLEIKEEVRYHLRWRGVAQLGSVLAWGASGRRFKSYRPDQ